MARDVTLRATYAELVGDETYELWLKHTTHPWELEDTGAVVETSGHQDFLIPTLVAGDTYVAQVRVKRSGRYRAGYLTSNPDSWPTASRCEFVPGALEDIDAPVIVSGVWSRTSSSATKIALTINPNNLGVNMKVMRDGVQIAVISAPHAGPGVVYNDTGATLGVNHTYVVLHTAGFLDGPPSVTNNTFAGPLPPTAFTRTSPIDQFGKYDLSWSAGSAVVRPQDDFLCTGTTFSNVIGGAGTTTASTLVVHKEATEMPAGTTHGVTFHARIRTEVTAFTVTDVSDWVSILIEMEIEDSNTDFNTCP